MSDRHLSLVPKPPAESDRSAVFRGVNVPVSLYVKFVEREAILHSFASEFADARDRIMRIDAEISDAAQEESFDLATIPGLDEKI